MRLNSSLVLVCMLAAACASDDGGADEVGETAGSEGSDEATETDTSTEGGTTGTGTGTGTDTDTAETDTEAEGEETTTDTDTGGGETLAPGLFIGVDDLERARDRASGGIELFEAQLSLVDSRAAAAQSEEPNPFHMDDVTQIRFGWCESSDDVDDTLSEASDRFTNESDDIHGLALKFALSEDPAYADDALARMLVWAEAQTLVNLNDLGVDFAAATLDDMTDGYCSDRPWNFALDTMWQAYGLTNIADSYLLLTRNGYALSEADDAALRDWILRVTEAVNSSFQAWTKWADAHPSSSVYERYRSDNHLSWAMVGLISAAVALDDDALADYVLEGGEWTDSRTGAYANPSSVRELIDYAIEGDGLVYEEKILRDPPVGYSFFHLWALSAIARVAELHYPEHDIWAYAGEDGGSLKLAFDRYAGFITGTKVSPEPDQEPDLTTYNFLYELPVARWDEAEHLEALTAASRNRWIIQNFGPVAVLVGVDP
ncbi:alginate lyase family protein [Pseudenhygromyxa sp. WMMC2535]|uniref:alginate lyase family protein n=1 Tax=Pseudenhygromyxa sp. WMMC2535 TaxID=2712867 RepID=UPI001553E3CE|nr:alginate lyase family protein [Pseudenhygromyxa sp. WMMC2535]NVB38005.1 alginate lyase family protein [Pseudenhygromyxa sp. WMMC2535]